MAGIVLWIRYLVMTSQVLAARRAALVYGETGRVTAYDPYTVHEASAKRLSDLIFDSLVETDAGGNYIPSLAREWKVENSGVSILFTLRDGVLWHPDPDGKATNSLSPNDVVTTVRLLKSMESDIPNSERFGVIAGVDVVAPNKVRIKFKRAMSDPLSAVLFKILPSHKLGSSPGLKRDADFARQPIGTGPYIFKKANESGEVLLAANETHFRGRPSIREIVMKSYADQSIMAQSLMFNSLDLMTYVSPRDLGEIESDRRLSTIPYDALSFSFFALNTSRGLLKDKRVRQAIGYAINREEMLGAFFGGQGTLISGPFPPTSWAYNLDVKQMKYEPARARKLLEETGLVYDREKNVVRDRKGKAVKFVFAVPLSGESEVTKKIVLAFQEYLKAVGIETELEFMDWLIWKDKVLKDHNYDITVASWSFDDSSNITSLFHSSSAKPWGNNFVMYVNPEVDSLLTEANFTNDFEKRRAIYLKLHAILADESPYTYLWTLTHHAAHNTRLKGVRVEPFSFFKHVASWRLTNRE
ncbi:MAG: hypothetical protein HQK54_02325 [Oligoflexales bacterium]|nr:hypothetical protein [Oligoflexales bacterium]